MKSALNSILLKKLIPAFVIFCVGIYVGISIARFKPLLFNLNAIPQDQMEIIILSEKLGKLISLPTDEKPIIETITDLSLLKDKPFFAKAEVGDKVLIYEKSAMAILYRPAKNIIINTVSPNYTEAILSINSPSPTPTLIPTPVPTAEPTLVPTPEPTIEATPTASPSATLTSTISPKPSAKP